MPLRARAGKAFEVVAHSRKSNVWIIGQELQQKKGVSSELERNRPACLSPFLNRTTERTLFMVETRAVEVFAAEEAEGGDGVGDGEAFGVMVGVEADGLEAVGDGGFGGFDVVAKFLRVQFNEGGLDLRLPVGIEVVWGRAILFWTILLWAILV